PAKSIESVNGAGDAYAAGLAYGFMNGYDIRYSMNIANILSYITLSSKSAVSENISKYKVLTMLKEIN
ncbi:MAG: PfkB family carbohydrate kinase, partial [Clostridia bacterium]|nr:PfkB family carbohydrate kinase [Clostridia bacterium]